MAEYIDREAALQFVFDACAECMDACVEFDGIYADCNQCMLEGVKLKLRDLPAADVRPVVQARWQYKTMTVPGGKGQTYAKWCCTACKGKAKERTNFCPNCGAMMEES